MVTIPLPPTLHWSNVLDYQVLSQIRGNLISTLYPPLRLQRRVGCDVGFSSPWEIGVKKKKWTVILYKGTAETVHYFQEK